MDCRAERPRNDAESLEIEERLRGVSELAMVCFLEGIAPGDLPLSEESHQESLEQLARLKSENPVVAYTFCLRRLSAGISQEGEA